MRTRSNHLGPHGFSGASTCPARPCSGSAVATPISIWAAYQTKCKHKQQNKHAKQQDTPKQRTPHKQQTQNNEPKQQNKHTHNTTTTTTHAKTPRHTCLNIRDVRVGVSRHVHLWCVCCYVMVRAVVMCLLFRCMRCVRCPCCVRCCVCCCCC